MLSKNYQWPISNITHYIILTTNKVYLKYLKKCILKHLTPWEVTKYKQEFLFQTLKINKY